MGRSVVRSTRHYRKSFLMDLRSGPCPCRGSAGQGEITMTTWISDQNGNRCSVEYWGTKEDAQRALDSLKNCSGCGSFKNCSDCSGCSGGWGCSDGSDCRGYRGCSGCSGCSYCSDCSDCS